MEKVIKGLVLLAFLLFGLTTFGQDSTAVQPKPSLGKGKGKVVAKDTIPPSAKPSLGKGKITTPATPTAEKGKNQQEKDTPGKVAKVREKKDRNLKQLFDRKKAPLKAVLLSATIPGAGQVYNRKYWKVPIVVGALGGMGYLIHRNTRYYKNYRQAYLYRVDDNEYTVDPYDFYDASSLKSLRDANRKNMELSYIGFFALYFLTGVDAFVDAHLSTFDVSEDLSMNLSPRLIPRPSGQTPVLGLGLSLQGRNNSKKIPRDLF